MFKSIVRHFVTLKYQQAVAKQTFIYNGYMLRHFYPLVTHFYAYINIVNNKFEKKSLKSTRVSKIISMKNNIVCNLALIRNYKSYRFRSLLSKQ